MEHRLKTLVRTPNCKVDHCSCGTVHVSVGGTTVRFNGATARELRDALVRALAEIDRPVASAPTPGVVLVPPPPPDSPDSDDEGDGGPKIH